MSGYPYNNPQQGYGYGGPPPSQPYSSSAPYGASQPPPSQPYSSSAPYGASPPPTQNPYAPSSTPYAAPSAPYAPSGPKPPKENSPYGGAHGPSPTGYPPQAQPAYGSSPFSSLVPSASAFPPGTDPSIVACFQIADRDGSGLIDDKELQGALSSYNQSFSLRTVHLLMYLFTNSNIRKIGHLSLSLS